MKLKEKFKKVDWEVLPISNLQSIDCVKIADDYAIDFANWCKQEYELEDTPYHNKWRDVDGRYISTEELLIKFKREVYNERNVD